MDMIETIGRIAASHIYTWQENSTIVAPANSRSIAQQFIRCTFQQLAANNISYQFFQQNFRGLFFYNTKKKQVTKNLIFVLFR
jgi:hypothetical protein